MGAELLARRATSVPSSKVALHTGPQSIPGGVLPTLVDTSCVVRVCCPGLCVP